MNGTWTITDSGLIVLNKTLVSDGEQNWTSRLDLSGYTQKILSPPLFQATTGTEYRLGILPGHLFPDDRRTTDNIRCIFAQESTFSGWKLHAPHLEVACLARESIAYDEMMAIGLSNLIFMRLPGLIAHGNAVIIAGKGRWLKSHDVRPNYVWAREYGFACVLSRIQD